MVEKVVRRSYWCPRWLYEAVNLPGAVQRVSLPAQVPPSFFANETPYRMRLVYLAFASRYHKLEEDPTVGWTASPMDDILVELGKTGCSDQNLQPGSIQSLTCPGRMWKQNYGGSHDGYSIDLPHPYRLPRDCGLEVEVANISAVQKAQTPITFVARGWTEDNWPLILAGLIPSQGLPGAGPVAYDSADLFNRGRCEAWIKTLSWMAGYDNVALPNTYFADGLNTAIRVNPTQGTPWMPGPDPIPAGLVGPQMRGPTWFEEGPKAYWFPEGDDDRDVWLDPRQRLSIKLTNLAATAHDLHICLFGELEVD